MSAVARGCECMCFVCSNVPRIRRFVLLWCEVSLPMSRCAALVDGVPLSDEPVVAVQFRNGLGLILAFAAPSQHNVCDDLTRCLTHTSARRDAFIMHALIGTSNRSPCLVKVGSFGGRSLFIPGGPDSQAASPRCIILAVALVLADADFLEEPASLLDLVVERAGDVRRTLLTWSPHSASHHNRAATPLRHISEGNSPHGRRC